MLELIVLQIAHIRTNIFRFISCGFNSTGEVSWFILGQSDHCPRTSCSCERLSDVMAAFRQCDMNRPTQPDPGVPGLTALVSSCSCGPLKYAYRIVIMRTMYS